MRRSDRRRYANDSGVVTRPHRRFLSSTLQDDRIFATRRSVCGRAQEFALFDAEACMPLATTLIGYSEAQDRVIQYSAKIEVISGPEGTTQTMYWVNYLFNRKPERRGYWKYQIDYRG